MYGGLPGPGAFDAWFATAIDTEFAMLHDIPLAGAIIDPMKCFDQIIRPLLYTVLALAGLPTCVLTAYVRFQESLVIHHVISGAVGKGHKHRSGIPQDAQCP